jgi:hypothetical protein
MFHIASHRGPLTFSLGLEQSIGVTSQRAQHDTGRYTPVDTLSGTSSLNASSNGAAGISASLVRASDIVGGLGWANRFSVVQLVAGMRTNDLHAGAWAGVNAAMYVGASHAFTLSLRRQSHAAAIQTPALALGFRSSYWHWGNGVPVNGGTTTNAPRPLKQKVVRVTLEGDTIHLAIHLPTARHVAVMGDATEWRPTDLSGDTHGWWHIALHATNAISRIQLQTDNGAWHPLPELPATHDEYGGTVTLLMAAPSPDE